MAGETVLTIIGNLTADVELRSTQNGRPVANLTIASAPRVWNRQSNQYEDGPALFMRCTAWGELAQHCQQTLTKGMRVIAQGRLSQSSYQDKEGNNRTVIEMTVDEIGPSLRYATAQVMKQQRQQGQNNGYSNQNPFGGAPAQQPPQQQYQQPPQQYTQPQPQYSQPPADPWGATGNGGWDNPDDPQI